MLKSVIFKSRFFLVFEILMFNYVWIVNNKYVGYKIIISVCIVNELLFMLKIELFCEMLVIN